MSGNQASRTAGDVQPLTMVGTAEYVCEGDACVLPSPRQMDEAGNPPDSP